MHETFATHTRESNTLYTAHLTWAIGLIWQIVACPQEAHSRLWLQPTGLQAPRVEQEVIAAHGGEYTFEFISLFFSFLLVCIVAYVRWIASPASPASPAHPSSALRTRAHQHVCMRDRFDKLFAKQIPQACLEISPENAVKDWTTVEYQTPNSIAFNCKICSWLN